MKKILLLIPIIVGLSACKPAEQVPPKYEEIRIIKVNPPKYFSVKYEILSTGVVRRDSNKRCSDWRRVKRGHVYIANTNKRGCDLIRSIKKY